MLTKEQYSNLSSQINYAHMNLNSLITKKCVVNDVGVMDLIIGYKEHLEAIQDILEFLLVQNISNNNIGR